MPVEPGTFIVYDPSHPEYQDSRRAGVRHFWPAWKEYEIKDGFLCEKRRSAIRTYYPITHKELPSVLGKINDGDEPALLRFASTYGLLGFESLAGSWPQNTKGDPLSWVWAHIRGIRFCLNLQSLIQDQDEHELRKLLKKVSCEVKDFKNGMPTLLELGMLEKVERNNWPEPSYLGSPLGTLGFGKYVLRSIVNRNISKICRAIEPEGNEEKSYFEYRALVEIVYWHLADAIAGGTVKRCEATGCGGFFIQTDGRQKFCPPLFNPKAESSCAVRERVRRNYIPKRKADKKPLKKIGKQHGKTKR